MRACVAVLKERIIPCIPEGIPIRQELQGIADEVFLELPEDPSVWRQAMRVLEKALPEDPTKHEAWHREVIKIWYEEVRGEVNGNK